MKILTGKKKTAPLSAPNAAQSLVDLASESWRFRQTLESCMNCMDPLDADRLANRYAWYSRKVQAVLDEAGLTAVDLTGEPYDPGMAVTPLNLEDFPQRPDAAFRIAQMVEPIIMENGAVRKTGSVMLSEDTEAL